jgi:hypothetical protein
MMVKAQGLQPLGFGEHFMNAELRRRVDDISTRLTVLRDSL